MFSDSATQIALDAPILLIVAVCIAALLGLFLTFAWLQRRSVRALAWWGSAYLIGAASMLQWSAPAHIVNIPPAIPTALIFVACGMMWNGVRLFQQRRLLPVFGLAGAAAWLFAVHLPAFPPGNYPRIVLGAVVVAVYTFLIAFELWRERRKSLYSRTAAIVVPTLHAGILLTPFVMRLIWPDLFAASWSTMFALETVIYAVGAAFIMLLLVEDRQVTVYRNAAIVDPLTGLINRRGFQEYALSLCARRAARRQPVSMLMFDLDHFKSINDRFGHAVGDDALRLFGEVARSNMRENDIVARYGGEEFAAIVPANLEDAAKIGERIRASFQDAGVTISGHRMNATVSIGIATSQARVTDLEQLAARADSALYRAKREGRNRVYLAGDTPAEEAAHLIGAAAAKAEPPPLALACKTAA
jgi:diguanylate cyclase (GGDEF)-like protein